jgi:ribosomal protein S18 acetylase RimI-like enzyme
MIFSLFKYEMEYSMNDEVVVRGTDESDWEDLKEIRLASLLDSPTAFGVTHAAAMTNTDWQWRDRAANRGPGRFTLAFKNGVAIGIVGRVMSSPSESNLIAMWVRPTERGTPIATRLVDAIKTEAISKRYSRVVLEVAPANSRAVAFYRRQGFKFLPEWEALASHPHIELQKMEWLT